MRQSRTPGVKKEIPMSTTVPTAWQIDARLTLQAGAFPERVDTRQHHIEFCGKISPKA
jgi:hypothetical protein